MPTTVQETVPHGDAHHHYQELIASLGGIVWEADVRTFQFTFVSQQAERLLGYPSAEWYTHGFRADHLHPDDRTWAPEFRRQAAGEKRNHDFKYRMIGTDGRIVWLRDRVTVVVEGNEVSEVLAQVRPEVEVMFMSGYTDEVVLREGLKAGAPFVQKPFSPLALAHKVREVLDARSDRRPI